MYTCRANLDMNLVFKQSPFVSNPLHSQYQAPSFRLVPFRANTTGKPCQFTIHSKACAFKLAKVLAITNIMSSHSVQPCQYPPYAQAPYILLQPTHATMAITTMTDRRKLNNCKTAQLQFR